MCAQDCLPFRVRVTWQQELGRGVLVALVSGLVPERMLGPQPHGRNGEGRKASAGVGKGRYWPVTRHRARGNPIWGLSDAAESWRHREARRQVGGSASVPGVSFVRRKTPAVAGVGNGGDNSKERS